MLRGVTRIVTERARRRILEGQVRAWLRQQLLVPAPGRPRDVVLGKGTPLKRTCHINPVANKVEGTEYVDLDVRYKQHDKVIMTIRISAARGTYVKTLWR